MEKENARNILVQTDTLCQKKYKISLSEKLGIKIEDMDDLATVLTSDSIDSLLSSGRIEFSNNLETIGSVIVSSTLAPLGLFGIAGLAWALKSEQKKKSKIYRDIVKQLYESPLLYEAFKKISRDNLTTEEAAEQLFSQLGF